MTREEAIRKLIIIREKFGPILTDIGETMDMAIAALREQPQWISVEERLPTPFVSVLVYMPGERPLPTVHEGFLAREGMWYANHFDREPLEITHWMPLPEPPKEEV
jgi:hypothetical protein